MNIGDGVRLFAGLLLGLVDLCLFSFVILMAAAGSTSKALLPCAALAITFLLLTLIALQGGKKKP